MMRPAVQGRPPRPAPPSAGNYQVIRTGSGDIDIATGRNVQLLNQFATIYTAGTKVSDPTTGRHLRPFRSGPASRHPDLGRRSAVPAYTPQYSFGGGNITIDAQGDIGHYTKDISVVEETLLADSSLRMPTNWLYRRGYVDAATGQFGTASVGTDVASTTWWVDFSNFFQGIGALGGGNASLITGGGVENVDAVIPTNARQPKNSRDVNDLRGTGRRRLTAGESRK